MTTSGVYGVQHMHDPIRGNFSPEQTRQSPPPPPKTNLDLLKEYIDKYLAGEITAEQLDNAKKTLQ